MRVRALLTMLLPACFLLQACYTATAAASDALSGPHVFGWGLSLPISDSSDGTHVWVANRAGGTTHQGSVTELDAATGALVRVIRGAQYGFNMPYAVSSDGTHVWAANFANGGGASEGASGTEL